MKRKVGLIFYASNQGGSEGGGRLSKDLLALTGNQWARAFRDRAAFRISAVSSDSPAEVGHVVV